MCVCDEEGSARTFPFGGATAAQTNKKKKTSNSKSHPRHTDRQKDGATVIPQWDGVQVPGRNSSRSSAVWTLLQLLGLEGISHPIGRSHEEQLLFPERTEDRHQEVDADLLLETRSPLFRSDQETRARTPPPACPRHTGVSVILVDCCFPNSLQEIDQE